MFIVKSTKNFINQEIYERFSISEKIEKHFENERLLDCVSINEIQNNVIEQNQIVFVNWDSLNKEGISLFMSDNEKDWNLSEVAENTRDEDRSIVLIIDENPH